MGIFLNQCKNSDHSEFPHHGEVVVSDGKTSTHTTKMRMVITNMLRHMLVMMMDSTLDPSESPLHGEVVASDGKILLPNHGRSTTRTLRERTSIPQSTLNWPSTTKKSMAKMMTRTSDPSESPLLGEAVASDGKILLPNHGRSTTRTLRERTSIPQSTLNWPSTTRKS